MIRYAKIVDEQTKLCEVGLGTNTEFYKSIGMTEQEVEQAWDGKWYLRGFAPSKPQPTDDEITATRSALYASTSDPIFASYNQGGGATLEEYIDAKAQIKYDNKLSTQTDMTLDDFKASVTAELTASPYGTESASISNLSTSAAYGNVEIIAINTVDNVIESGSYLPADKVVFDKAQSYDLEQGTVEAKSDCAKTVSTDCRIASEKEDTVMLWLVLVNGDSESAVDYSGREYVLQTGINSIDYHTSLIMPKGSKLKVVIASGSGSPISLVAKKLDNGVMIPSYRLTVI